MNAETGDCREELNTVLICSFRLSCPLLNPFGLFCKNTCIFRVTEITIMTVKVTDSSVHFVCCTADAPLGNCVVLCLWFGPTVHSLCCSSVPTVHV